MMATTKPKKTSGDTLASILTGDPTVDAQVVYHLIRLPQNGEAVSDSHEMGVVTRAVLECWSLTDLLLIAADSDDLDEFLRTLKEIRGYASTVNFVVGMRLELNEASAQLYRPCIKCGDESFSSGHECVATCCVRVLHSVYVAASPQTYSNAAGGQFDVDDETLTRQWTVIKQWLHAIPRLDLSEVIGLVKRESTLVIRQLKDAGEGDNQAHGASETANKTANKTANRANNKILFPKSLPENTDVRDLVLELQSKRPDGNSDTAIATAFFGGDREKARGKLAVIRTWINRGITTLEKRSDMSQ